MPSKQITFQNIEQVRQRSPKRRQFSDHPAIYKRDDETCVVSLPFRSIDSLFRQDTQIDTRSGGHNYYQYLSDQKEMSAALKWHDRHKRFIFLRDNLDCSVALDYNFAERGVYTDLGLAEYNAKNARHRVSIEILSRACVRAISEISLYRGCDVICAVPPSPEKEWDLPTELARLVSERTGKPDVSAVLYFRETKKSIKATSLEEKWETLNSATLYVDQSVCGRKVILLDDKYQSGITAQFVASKLYDAGAEEVNGLFCIKTWRDTDNQ